MVVMQTSGVAAEPLHCDLGILYLSHTYFSSDTVIICCAPRLGSAGDYADCCHHSSFRVNGRPRLKTLGP